MSRFVTVSKGQTYNVSEDAARILRSATEAVQAIIARRDALDLAGKRDQSLFVIAGEYHPVVSHTIHHMLVLKHLTGIYNDVAIGYECSHDVAKDAMLHLKSNEIDDEQAIKIFESKKHSSKITLQGALAVCNGSLLATRFLQFAMCEDIPLEFTDVSYDDKGILKKNDRTTQRSARKSLGLLRLNFENIKHISREGMRVRNHHMVERASEYIESHRPRIFFQHCGNGHATGIPLSGDFYKESMAAYAKKKGLPIFVMTIKDDNSGLNYMLDEGESHRLYHLPTPDEPYGPFKCELPTVDDQVIYTNGVLEEAGLREYALDYEELELFRAQCGIGFKLYCDEILGVPSPR